MYTAAKEYEYGIYEYIDHLYGRNMDGYVQIIQKRKGEETPIIKSGKKGNIFEMAEKMTGYEDVAISPNTFYIPVRRSSNIRHFRALYVDLDLEGRNIKFSKTEAVYQAYMRAEEGRIPRPTMAVDLGRGGTLVLENRRRPISGFVHLASLGRLSLFPVSRPWSDRAVTDSARVLRLPGTVNSRNGETCEVMYIEENIYNMRDLREKYLHWKPKKESVNTGKRGKVNHLFTPYHLHFSRAKDIEMLFRLRDYDMKNYRNKAFHVYAYWTSIYERNQDIVMEELLSLNQKLVEPHTPTEIGTMLRSVDRAVERYITALAEGERGGYWYTNEHIIEELEITEEEQKRMKTLISKEEKYRRNNARRRKERRGKDGLTSRQRQKKETIEAVAKFHARGLKQKEIAQKLGLSKGRVSQIINYEL